MITVITGLPGSGKSYYIVQYLREQLAKGGVDRRYFQNGITGVAIPGLETFEPEKWFELPDKSVFVIDEAQRIFPVASPGVPIPRKLSEFETHRHRGMDVFLITQDATLIHHHLRKLIGEHIHIERPFGMAFANVFHFQGVRNPRDWHDRQSATKSVMKYSSDVYGLYQSATHHTVKRRLPFKLLLLPALLVVLGIAGYYAYTGLRSQQRTVDQAGNTVKTSGGLPGLPSGLDGPRKSSDKLTKEEWLAAFVPRVAGQDWTAPRYDDMTKAQDYPRVAACIAMEGLCTCWTHQATKVKVPDATCRAFIEFGEFDDRFSAATLYGGPQRTPQAALVGTKTQVSVVPNPGGVGAGSGPR